MNRELERKQSLNLIIAAYLLRCVDAKDDDGVLLREHAMSAALSPEEFLDEVNRVREANA